MLKILLVMFALTIGLGLSRCEADSSNVKITPATQPRSKGITSPYCGIYCLYAASLKLQRPIAFESLLNDEYISSYQGSSLADLINAATDHGLYALAFGNGTIDVLRSTPYPVILHVTIAVGYRTYSHYVVLLSVKGDDFTVLDPSRSVQVINSSDLLAIWDRSGIVISTMPLSTISLFWSSWVTYLLFASLVFLILIWLRRILNTAAILISQWPAHAVTCIRATTILLFAGVLSVGFHAFAGTGFLRRPDLVLQVEKSHITSFLPHISLNQFVSRGISKSTLIDARFLSDYAAGHIDGAISIPLGTVSPGNIVSITDIPHDQPLVLYCQNRECPLAGALANILLADGYLNVSLLDGGYDEWLEAKLVSARKL